MEKQNRLNIYKNKRKVTENHPDLNGVMYLNEPLPAGEYNIGLYSKENKSQEKYYSGVIKKVERK